MRSLISKTNSLLLPYLISFFLITNVYAATVKEHLMTNEPEDSICGQTSPPKVNVFDARKHSGIYLYYVVDGVEYGDVESTKWYYQNVLWGETESVWEETGNFCSSVGYTIKGDSLEYMTGNWQVDFYWNGEKVFTEQFFLKGSRAPVSCLAEYVLDDDEETLNVLRHFRDEVLKKTETGTTIIQLYYGISPIAVRAIEDNPVLKTKLKCIFKALVPVVDTFL
jgi:hypothetical protein